MSFDFSLNNLSVSATEPPIRQVDTAARRPTPSSPVGEQGPVSAYDKIQQLTPREQIRLRPGMWLGNVEDNGRNSACMNMVGEVVGNSVDEFVAGYGDTIKISLSLKDSPPVVSVRDFGRGIPIAIDPDEGISYLEMATSHINSGGKYAQDGEDSPYENPIGLHGAGLKATNFCSKNMSIVSVRDGESVAIYYVQGVKESEFRNSANGAPRGTGVTFQFDPEIIRNHELLPFRVEQYLQEIVYLNAGLKIEFEVVSDAGVVQKTLYEPDGILSYLGNLLGDKQTLLNIPTIWSGEADDKICRYELALAVTTGTGEEYHTFVNGGRIGESSLATVALKQSIAKAILQFAQTHGPMDVVNGTLALTTDDARSGAVGVLKIKHKDPRFESQTKTKLINNDISGVVRDTLPQMFLEALQSNPEAANKIVENVVRSARARVAAAEARAAVLQGKQPVKAKRQKAISLDIYQPPLTDDPEANSIYLFEGPSASGTLVEAAKRKIAGTSRTYKENIGILSLRGVPPNAFEKTLDQVLANKEYATLVEVTGLNPAHPEDLSGLKFHKIIIASDHDAGGDHICMLLLAFFVRHFPEVVTEGHLFRVHTPFFELIDRKSKASHFIYAHEDKAARIQELGYSAEGAGKDYDITRFKGLGELSITARNTLVQEPMLESFAVDDLAELQALLGVYVGEGRAEERRNLLFAKGLVEE